jgi:hypothetical protein
MCAIFLLNMPDSTGRFINKFQCGRRRDRNHPVGQHLWHDGGGRPARQAAFVDQLLLRHHPLNGHAGVLLPGICI